MLWSPVSWTFCLGSIKLNISLALAVPVTEDIRVVELFAGVGGFRCGLEAASPRFKTVWANQWEPGRKDQFAFNCYSHHFSGTGSVNVNEDIGKVKGEIPEHDLLVGGFPCQDYSVASTNAKGIEGKKGVLWWYINDIVKAKRPKYVLLENVDRLLRSPASQRGRDFGIILRCMADNGYSVEWRVINAADYGFVQRRRRTFIFATRDDTAHFKDLVDSDPRTILFSRGFFARGFPVDGPIKGGIRGFSISEDKFPSLVDVSDGFKEDFGKAGVMIGHRVFTADVVPMYDGPRMMLGSVVEPCSDERYYQDATLDKWREMKGPKRIQRVNKRTGVEYIYSEGGIPFPDPLDRPGRTMLTSEGSKNRSSHLIEDPSTHRYRILTPVECERLNGFPDGWTDTMSERQRYFTMGNALVVGLIEIFGQIIINMESNPDDVRQPIQSGLDDY